MVGWFNCDLFNGRNTRIYYELKNEEWVNLIATYNATTHDIKFYINSILKNTTNYLVADMVWTKMAIGGNSNFGEFSSGYYTAARIYDRVLTDEEIALLATEFTPHYQITASDLTFSLYQKNETYGISYSSAMTPVTFEIIEGTLPNTISFNTSTGQFSGKGLTDADHTYNLKVRLTAPNSDPATCNVTIYTYKTARISLSNQSFSFISNKAENFAISYTSDEAVTFTIESGTLPAGMSLASDGYFSSSGTNTSAETQQVVVRATSANNQTGVTATMALNMQMNSIVLNAQTLKFYTAQGAKTKAVKYSGSLNAVTDAVFSMTGALPAGVTFDSTTGSFTSDGTQTADETASVSVTVSSSSGTSTAATAAVTLEVSMEDIVDPIIEDGLTLFIPCENDWSAQQGVALNSVGTEEPTSTTNDGKKCIYFNGKTILANQDDSYWNLNGNRGEAITMCFWFKADLTNITGDETFICQIGNDNGYSDGGCTVYKRSDTNIIQQMEFGHWENGILTNDLSGWHFYAMQFNGSNGGLDTYVDGVKKYGQTRGYPICKSRTVTIGKLLITYNPLAFRSQRTNEGWYTRIRLYNRLLTDSEIQALAEEFTPMPTSGLVFYAPLSSKEDYAQTGQTLNYTNIAVSDFTTLNGIPCLYKRYSGRYIFSSIPAMSGKNEFTFSLWCNFTAKNSYQSLFAIGQYSPSSKWAGIGATNTGGRLDVYSNFEDLSIQADYSTNIWYNLCVSYDGQTVKFYIGGTLVGSQNTSAIFFNESTQVDLLTNPNNLGRFEPNGYFAAARVYDRALTQDEIDTLASEFTVQYEITAQDLTFSLYQKNETYGISYSSAMTPVTFEIIEGSLPNTISFNTSTGQFSGKGLTDSDHTYNLKVRLTAPDSTPATCNVTIHTYMTARISLYNQSFSFISNKAESKSISYTSDEAVTFAIESGTLPAGMTFSSGRFYSNGQNTSADNQQVVVRATSANNQTGVTATMTLDMQMNTIVCNAQTFKFYTAQGAKTEAVKYSGSLNEVTDAVFSMTGTLPTGVTWDATTGSFTSDGTQTADETASVSVTVSSANGTSTAATATMTIEVHLGEAPIADDYVFYMPMTSISNFESTDANITVTNRSESMPVEFTTQDGIDCAYFYGNEDRSLKVNNISNSWPFAGTGRTISLWVKCAVLSNQNQGILWYGGAYGNAKCIWIGINASHKITADTYNGGLGDNIVSGEPPVVSDLNWHHYVITLYNNESGKLHGCIYTDGIMSMEGGWNSYALDTTVSNVAFIGGYSDQSVWSKTLNGYIAGFRVYDRVLEESEIQDLASEFTPTA